VHICCSVDSHFFLQKLRDEKPDEKIEAYFFNPNIHPKKEYQLRLLDVERSCDILGIELHEGEYDTKEWFSKTKGFETAPEKGERCSICFDNRFERSAIFAKNLGHSSFTSTLLMSPKKSMAQLITEGKNHAKKHNIEFLTFDFRKDGGTNEQFLMAKNDRLYHQNYCGCIYALNTLRESQGKFCGELVSDIGGKIARGSLDERFLLYHKRLEYEKMGVPYRIQKHNFINYQLLRAYVRVSKMAVIHSYFIYFSSLSSKKIKARAEFLEGGVYYSNKAGVVFLDIRSLNILLSKNYQNVSDMVFNPPSIKQELDLRAKIFDDSYNSSSIVVLDSVEFDINYEIVLNCKTYEDTKESIMQLEH
jgi:predicted adenine nucleotide alpha hydrolase (AANH) superfamily ATPase